MKLAHSVNYASLTHCSHLGKGHSSGTWGQGWAAPLHFIMHCAGPGSCMEMSSSFLRHWWPWSLCHPRCRVCVCSLGARAGAGSGRQKYSQEGESWFGYWARRKVCFFKITLCWCILTPNSFINYTTYWAWIPKQDILSFQFYTYDKNINGKHSDLQSVNIQSILHGTQWLCVVGAQHSPFSLPRAFPI